MGEGVGVKNSLTGGMAGGCMGGTSIEVPIISDGWPSDDFSTVRSAPRAAFLAARAAIAPAGPAPDLLLTIARLTETDESNYRVRDDTEIV